MIPQSWGAVSVRDETGMSLRMKLKKTFYAAIGLGVVKFGRYYARRRMRRTLRLGHGRSRF